MFTIWQLQAETAAPVLANSRWKRTVVTAQLIPAKVEEHRTSWRMLIQNFTVSKWDCPFMTLA